MGSSPIQTISLRIFYTFERGDQPNLETFRKFMEYVLSSRPTMTQVPRQSLKINYTVSMGNFEIFIFTDHQKDFCKFSIFSTQFHWRAFFFSNLKSESRDQMNVGKVQSIQINSVVMLGVLGAHELFQINSHFCPVFCPLPLIFLPSNFAFSFALFHIYPIFCPHFLPLPLPSAKKEGKGKGKGKGKNEGKI